MTLLGAAIVTAILPSSIGGLFFLAAGIPLVVYAAVRGFRISLAADHDEIIVRNYFRTHHVRWEHVQAIGVGFHAMAGVPVDAIVISRQGQRSVSAQATTANSRERQRVLSALRRMRPDLPIRYYSMPA